MIKKIFSFLKYIANELLIIFILIFLINNYIGKTNKTIHADGVGYYDYLPSIFIHHDILRKDKPIQECPNIYERINNTDVYVNYKDFKVNKYPCGTALLHAPFFVYTYLTTDLDGNYNDGYQKPFQKTIFYSTVFYLFLSLIFLKKVLKLYNIKGYIIFFIQLILVLSTSVIHYTNIESAFSHIYSLFAITAFIYFMKSYLQEKKLNHFVLSCLFLGLVFILRQVNILIVLFIPFLAGSTKNLKDAFITLFAHKKSLIIGILLFIGMSSIQAILWYMQTGSAIVYSYQGESFNFLEPHLFSILFSYKKGLFVYTPVLLIALLSLFWFAYKKEFFLLTTWICFFVLLTYVLSSWHSWFYGCSYGLRAYIDYYAIFFIPFAIMLDKIKTVPKLIIMAITLPTIPLNIIQTYQYKEYILHWINMDKEKYWKVFLKTDDRYKGLVWKKSYDYNNYNTEYEINIGDIYCPKKTENVIQKISSYDIPNFDKIEIIQVLFDNDFKDTNDTKILLYINNSDDNQNHYWHQQYLIQFYEKNLNEWHTGLYNFEFNPFVDDKEKDIVLVINTPDYDDFLKNVRMKFLSKNITD